MVLLHVVAFANAFEAQSILPYQLGLNKTSRQQKVRFCLYVVIVAQIPRESRIGITTCGRLNVGIT